MEEKVEVKKEKKSVVRRILRFTFRFVAISVALILLLWAVVVGAILTPEILTPQVEAVGQKFTKSEFSVSSVDLSLFERFPNVTLRIDSLRITQTKDSIADLIFAEQCQVSVNPVALLSKDVVVNRVLLKNASVYLYVDSLNGPLKCFNLPGEVEQEEADSLNKFDISEYTFSLNRFTFDSTNIIVDDRIKRFYTRVEDFDIDMSMNLTPTISDLDVVTGFKNLIVWNDGDLLVKKTSLKLSSEMEYDRDSLKLSFNDAQITLNRIDLTANGTLRKDTVAKGVLMDIKSSLTTPSLTEFLALIPSSILDNKDKISADGAVAFDIDVNGLYADNSLPTAGVTLKIDKAKAKYASRKLALEQVDCDAYMFVDFNKPTKSYASIKSLHINTSKILDLNVSGRVSNILQNPYIDMSLYSNIDFDRFSEVFPLNECIVLSGTNSSNLKLNFNMADVQNSNYADLYINGESNFKDLEVSFDPTKFDPDSSALAYLYVQAESGKLLFGDNVLKESDSRTLRSVIDLMGLGYKTKTGESVTVKDIHLVLGANFDRKTSTMNGLGIKGVAKSTEIGVDSMFTSTLESSEISLIVIPKNEKQRATVKGSISSRMIEAVEPTFNSDLKLSSVDMNLMLQRPEDETRGDWDMEGTVAFSDLNLFTNLFPLHIEVPATSVSVNNKTINLHNAELLIGKSRVKATGEINHLMRKIFYDPKSALSGKLKVDAAMLDINEIIDASNKSYMLMEQLYGDTVAVVTTVDSLSSVDTTLSIAQQDTTTAHSADSMAVDSSSSAGGGAMFLVPNRMNFVFDLNIAKALMDEAVIENIAGCATIDNGVLTLDNVRLTAIDANASASMVYRNINRKTSNIAANMILKGVDINRIGEVIPSVESMLPMIKSFEGIVDFDFKANMNLNEFSEVDYSTLYSAMRFKGKNLVVMDGATFADISKKLRFKNRDRNLIDSLEVYALVDETKIDVLPFAMSIDRYIAYIGGTQTIDPQTFDVDYAYNISIIKSPLPFKAGVDVFGNLNDFDFKITKAKLKKTNFEQQRAIYNEYCQNVDKLEDVAAQEYKAWRKEMRKKRQAQREALEKEKLAADAEENDSLLALADTTLLDSASLSLIDSLRGDSLALDSLKLADSLIVDSVAVTDSLSLIDTLQNDSSILEQKESQNIAVADTTQK